jgi:hypothetical protein
MEKMSDISKSELLSKLEKWFSDSSEWDREWRDNAKVCYNYYNGTQWTSEEVDALLDRGQAVTTYNHIAPSIDSIVGGERQNRPQISMVGRTKDDEQIAQVKTSLYDYIADSTNSDDELDRCMLDACVTGRGWMSIYPSMNGEEFENVVHAHIDYRDMFIDSYSKRDDLKDARYIHQAVYTDEDIVKHSFPKYDKYTASVNTSAGFSSFESSSDDEMFFDEKDRTRPRLINTWYRDEKGAMNSAVWVKGQLLYVKKQPFTMPDYPYSQVTIKRDLDNKPYGFVRSMISAQDEVNKRHSKALHYLNARQVLAEEDAFVSWDEAKKTLAKPDGITKLVDGALSGGRIQIVDNTALAATHIQMMEHAKGQVMAMAGINASYLGQSGQYESAKKAQGSISAAQNVLVPMLNKWRMFRHRIAVITMKLVPDFYTDEKLIRILEPSGEYAFMPVNAPMLMDDGTIKRMNDLTTDDVDVSIEDAPTGLNDRVEQFNQLLGIQGQTGRPIPMEILLRYSGLKDKHQLAAELEQHYAMDAQLQQAQQQVQQMQQQIEAMGGQVQQVTSQLTQSNVARAVDSEVYKVKAEIQKEKQQILGS